MTSRSHSWNAPPPDRVMATMARPLPALGGWVTRVIRWPGGGEGLRDGPYVATVMA